MTTAMSDIAEEEFAQASRQGGVRPVFGYYRKPDGDITFDVTSPMERLHYLEEGWKYLPEYGSFDATTEYTANHPFETLFLFGGAEAMPVQQVIDNGFHVWPPEIPGCKRALDQSHKRHSGVCWSNKRVVKFPQLAGSGAKAWPCTFCAEVRATEAGIENHMTVVHRQERGEMRGGEAIAAAIVKGLTPPQDDASRLLAVLNAVGLNKSQRSALVKAGLIEAQEDDDADEG